MENIQWGETNNSTHPQALLHPPTTSPRDFAGYTHFLYRILILKLKVKDGKEMKWKLSLLTLLSPVYLYLSVT